MPELIYNDAPGAVPATYRFPPGLDARLSSVSAMFDGSGAGGAFLPCLSVYSQDSKLVGRFFPEEVAAGDSAEVTFAPFLGAAAAGGTPGGITSFAFLNSLGGQTFLDASQTIITPLASQHVAGTAFTADPANGQILFNETGIFTASALVDFPGYYSPLTLALSVFAGDGSIFPYENTVAAVYQAFAFNPPGMGVAGSFFLSVVGNFAIGALNSTPPGATLDLRIINDSGASRTMNSAVLQIEKIGEYL